MDRDSKCSRKYGEREKENDMQRPNHSLVGCLTEFLIFSGFIVYTYFTSPLIYISFYWPTRKPTTYLCVIQKEWNLLVSSASTSNNF